MGWLAKWTEGAQARSPRATRVAGKEPAGVDPRGVDVALSAMAIARNDGRLAVALACLNSALACHPASVELRSARGKLLFDWRRFHEARREFFAVYEAGLRDSDTLMHLGWVDYGLGDLPAAERWFHEATHAKPDRHDAHAYLGFVQMAQKRLDEAVRSYERALDIAPVDVDSLLGIANCFLDSDPAAAESWLRRALEAGAEPSLVHGQLGMAMALQDRNADAMVEFERSVALESPDAADRGAFLNLAIHLGDEGRTDEALRAFENGLPGCADVEAHLAYAHTLLRAGRLIEGWERYEFRWMVEPGVSRRRSWGAPMWSGQDLRGETILLVIEQGQGDTFQFVRYAPLLKALGATTVMMPGGILWNVARSFPGVDVLAPNEASLPRLDYYIPLMSLPRVFRTDLDSIPADVPYIKPDASREEFWRTRLPDGEPLKVGLAWAGSAQHKRDRYRTMSLAQLAPLVGAGDVRFVSLQKGPAAAEAGSPPHGMDLLDIGPELADWSDTAAVISQLDVVIGVDTAVMHLAGAMGVPAWMMIAQPPDFRWLEHRDDSPWYPTLRLFRQERRGEWAEVVARVAAALRDSTTEPDAANTRAARTAAVRRDFRATEPTDGPGPAGRFAAVAETRYGLLEYLPQREYEGNALRYDSDDLAWHSAMVAALQPVGGVTVISHAGVGVPLLALSAAAGTTGQLFAYEPDPILRAMLSRNLAVNGVKNVSLMRRRLGDPTGAPEDTDTIDTLGLSRLDLVTIGDAALAATIIDGAAQALWTMRPAVVAWGADEACEREIARILQEYGYRCWRVATPLTGAGDFARGEGEAIGKTAGRTVVAVAEERELPPSADEWMAL